MKNLFLIAVGMAAMFAVSCANNLDINEKTPAAQPGRQILTAQIVDLSPAANDRQSAPVRTAIDASNYLTWTAGEGLSVFIDGDPQAASVSSVSADSRTAYIDAPVGTIQTALTPASSTAAFAADVITGIVIPDVQSAVAGSFDPKALHAVGYFDGAASFTFKSAVALLKITVGDDNITDIIVSADQNIAGTANVDISAGDPAVSLSSGVSSVRLTAYYPNHSSDERSAGDAGTQYLYPADDSNCFTNGSTYYIAVAPADITSLTVKYIKNVGGTVSQSSKTRATALSIEAGKIYNIGSMSMGSWDAFFTPGDALNIAGAGVNSIDTGHHMTYMPDIDYHPTRSGSAPLANFFSDFARNKNDQGTERFDLASNNWFNNWHSNWPGDTRFDTDYFDYEIFVKLDADEDVYFTNGSGAYIARDENAPYKWKAQLNTATGHPYGKTSIIISDTPVAFQVQDDAIYRIRFNSATKECYITQIGARQSAAIAGVGAVIMRFWPEYNGSTLEYAMDYQGKGVWSRNISFTGKMAGGDVFYNANAFAGYKFLFGGCDQDQPYGRQYTFESAPTTAANGANFTEFDPSSPDLRYWSITPVRGGGWSSKDAEHGTWTVNREWTLLKGKTGKFSIYMNDTYGAYVNSLVILP